MMFTRKTDSSKRVVQRMIRSGVTRHLNAILPGLVDRSMFVKDYGFTSGGTVVGLGGGSDAPSGVEVEAFPGGGAAEQVVRRRRITTGAGVYFEDMGATASEVNLQLDLLNDPMFILMV